MQGAKIKQKSLKIFSGIFRCGCVAITGTKKSHSRQTVPPIPQGKDFPAPAPAKGRKIMWGGEYVLAAAWPGGHDYAAIVSKSSLALLLAGLAPSTVSRC